VCCERINARRIEEDSVRLPLEAVSVVDAGLHMTPCLFETQHQRARCTHAMPFQAHEKVGKQYLLIARWLMDW